jgi:hypothetical protein
LHAVDPSVSLQAFLCTNLWMTCVKRPLSCAHAG